jgi:surface protein
MNSMFRQSNFNQDIGSWDVSRVNNMSYMFYLNNDFNNSGSSSINNWNVSNVTTFLEMFSGGTIFNQPIGNWQINTSSAVSMDRMFDGNAGTPQFNQPIGSWDTSMVTNMNNMFRSNTIFNQDIGTWNVGNVTTFGTNFMSGKNAANYSYLHTIYDGGSKTDYNLT